MVRTAVVLARLAVALSMVLVMSLLPQMIPRAAEPAGASGAAAPTIDSGSSAAAAAGGRRLAATHHDAADKPEWGIFDDEESCDSVFDRYGGVLVLVLCVLYLFLGLAIVCHEYFVPALERLVEILRLPEDVAGATFLAVGLSSPQLFTSLVSVFGPANDIGIGTIVGSAVFNITFIASLVAVASGEWRTKVDWVPLVRDSVFYTCSIILLFVAVYDPHVELWEPILLILGYILYVVVTVAWSRLVLRFNSASHSAMQQLRQLVRRWRARRLKEGRGATTRFNSLVERLIDPVEEGIDGKPIYVMDGEGPQQHPEDGEQQSGIGSGGGGGGRHVADDGTGSGGIEMSSAPSSLSGGAAEGASTASSAATASPSSASSASAATLTARRVEQFGVEDPEVVVSAAAGGGGGGGSGDGSGGLLQLEHAREHAVASGESEFARRRPWLALAFRVLCWPYSLLYRFTIPDCKQEAWRHWWPVAFASGILWIGVLSYLLVELATHVGCILRIPSAVMGLTLIAFGEGMPDAITSALVAYRGFGNMAISNIFGSNIVDIHLGLGLPWLISIVLGREVDVDDEQMREYIVVLLLLVVVFVGMLAAARWHMYRWMAIVFFGLYAVFNAFVLLREYV